MSREFDSKKDSLSTKLEWRRQILAKLSFDSKLSGLHIFDMAIIHCIKNWLRNRKVGCKFMRHQSLKDFCDPHWELICHNKWNPGTSEISTPLMRNIALKLFWYFYLLMKKPQSPYYQTAQWNQKTPIPVSARWQVLSENTKKRTSINTNHTHHKHSSP